MIVKGESVDDIGARVKHERTRRGLSQEDLAALSGVTSLTILRVEKGVTRPRLETIRKIAASLSMTDQQLLFGTGFTDTDVNEPDLDASEVRAIAAQIADSSRDMLRRLRILDSAAGLPPKEIAKVKTALKQQERHVQKMERFEADIKRRTGQTQ
jgi:transcriptional regulator with XRE-family HTH domain